MDFAHPFIGAVALKKAIDYRPLIVSANTPLLEVMAHMSQVQGKTCGLVNHQCAHPSVSHRQTSCALVVAADHSAGPLGDGDPVEQPIAGIFTERDIVKLVAQDADLATLTMADVMVSPVVSLHESEFNDIFAPLFLFRRYRIRHLLIVGDGDRPVGIVSPESIRSVLQPANLLKLRRVSDIMARDVICADYQVSVLHTAQLMANHRVSCVVITEEDGDRGSLPIGIVTERDIVQFKTLNLNLVELGVGVVMSSPLCLLEPDDSLWKAHQEMQRLRVRRLVVSWNWGKGLGIVTQTTLLRVFDPLEMYGVLETLQTTVQNLNVQNLNVQNLTVQDLTVQNLTSETRTVPERPDSPPLAMTSVASLPTHPVLTPILDANLDMQHSLKRLGAIAQNLTTQIADLDRESMDSGFNQEVLLEIAAIQHILQNLEKRLKSGFHSKAKI